MSTGKLRLLISTKNWFSCAFLPGDAGLTGRLKEARDSSGFEVPQGLVRQALLHARSALRLRKSRRSRQLLVPDDVRLLRVGGTALHRTDEGFAEDPHAAHLELTSDLLEL